MHAVQYPHVNIRQLGIQQKQLPIYRSLFNNLQSNIILPHDDHLTTLLFIRFNTEDKTLLIAIKAWIQQFATRISSTAQQLGKCSSKRGIKHKHTSGLYINFFLSAVGYERLSLPLSAFDSRPKEKGFEKGMKKTIQELYDPEVSQWESPFQQEIDALILVGSGPFQESAIKRSTRKKLLATEVASIKRCLKGVAKVVHQENGETLYNDEQQAIEHFGFRDNISNPDFFSPSLKLIPSSMTGQNGEVAAAKAYSVLPNRAQHEDWDHRASLRTVLAPDPFVYKDETTPYYGSFLVFRKLEQDVDAFNEDMRAMALKLFGDADQHEKAAALVMGRFRNGTPITLSDKATNALSGENDFHYMKDTAGNRCPFHAHIRRMNPRGDAEKEYGLSEYYHYIVRRSTSYGKIEDEKAPKGMLFLCYQSNVNKQFMELQQKWANHQNFIHRDSGTDALIGNRENANSKWPDKYDSPSRKHFQLKEYVRFRGGEYFFAPSIYFLKNIVRISQQYSKDT